MGKKMKNKKILIVGKRNHLGWLEHTIDGIKQIENIFYDTFIINEIEPFYKPLKLFYKVLSQKEKLENLISKSFEKKIKDFNPDLIIFISGFFIPVELYKIAKKHNIKTASWIGDKFGENAKTYVSYIDKLYLSDTGLLDVAKQMEFKDYSFLQFGYNNLIHKNYGKDRNEYMNFVGSYTKERNNVFMKLHDYKLHLEGINWHKLDSISKNWIVNKGKISQEKVVDIYNTTRATLNIGQNENIINMVNMRTFEAIACGSCVISDNLKDLEYCFEPNKEILVYNNINELIEILNKASKESNYLKNIALNAYNKITKDNMTYKSKIEFIINDFN